jgi:glycine cleavage system pyridoxal-binding protein P
VRIGTVEELVEYAKSFQAVGTDLLTLTLVDPPGASGIEKLAPVIEALR